MDLHHNLFYSYRGPIAYDADRDRQLENNLTKALINCCKLGGETVSRPFLAELGISGVPSDFLLQRCDLPGGAANRRHRVLLGISKEKSTWSPAACTESTCDGRPDAWIYGDGFAVLLESKASGDFLPRQMDAHRRRLWPAGGAPPEIKLFTWKQLHSLFSIVLPRVTNPVSQLLVKQFIQFLEYSGMSGFTGFRQEHFEYFVLHDDEDARRWIIDQVKDFATQVRDFLREFAPFYIDCDIGVLRRNDSYCWFAFGPHDYRKMTHQSMSLSATGLTVFVNAELKPATDRLKTVVRQSGDVLRRTLQNLHLDKPFELVLKEKRRRQVQLFDYTLKIRLHSSMLSDDNTREIAWNAFSQTVQQLPLLGLSIERHLPPNELIKLSDRQAVEYVVEMLTRNHAVVELLNQSIRVRRPQRNR